MANENKLITLEELGAAFAVKQDKETGKGLSTNDYTTAEKDKLAAIEAGAQVNPTDTVKYTVQSLTDAQKTQARANIGATAAETGKGLSTNDYTTAEKSKLAGIEAGAEVNVNADWSASSGDAQILNKPTTLAGYGITSADALLAAKQDALTFDSTPTANSTNPATSGGIKTALDALDTRVTALEQGGGPVVTHTIYGFHIDSSESDPATCVTYLMDAIGKTPAAMNYTTGVFSYGGWANAFFMPRPCMLKYDGTVDYYLDPDDYTKKADGVTASDVADDTYSGNAMMEWGQGGKRIWYKIVPDAGDNTSASVYIADYQADSDYRAWSFVNNQGMLVDHFYTPIYNGSVDSNGRLRSISGIANTGLCQDKTAAQEVAAAELCNPSTDKLWYTEVYADVILIDLLLILMGKSLNTQAVFGRGRTGQSSTAESMIGTGTMDDKGLFWGSNANNYGVKVFGMENWWGNQWRRYAGYAALAGQVQKYKLTRTTADGSTAADYAYSSDANDYTGYLTGATGPSANSFIGAMQFSANAPQPVSGDGTSSQYWCDMYYVNTGVALAVSGGVCSSNEGAGAFAITFGYTPTSHNWKYGASLSCKPLAA